MILGSVAACVNVNGCCIAGFNEDICWGDICWGGTNCTMEQIVESAVGDAVATVRKDNRKRCAKTQPCFNSHDNAMSRVLKHLDRWQKKMLIPGVNQRTWVGQLMNGNLVCVCCRKYSQLADQCPLASAEGRQITKWLRLQNLKSHVHSADHKQCVAAFLRDDDVSNVQNVASSAADFLEVLSSVRSKKLPKSFPFAGRKKLRAMIYALAEAVRHFKLRAFRTATQASLHHDGAEDKLICRFSLSDKDGARRCGFLSLVNLVESYSSLGSVALAQGLCDMVAKTCQQNVNAPYKKGDWLLENISVDDEAKSSLIAAVSLLDADAASDERRAMRIVSQDATALNVPKGMLPKTLSDDSVGDGEDADAATGSGPLLFPDVPAAVGENEPDIRLPDVIAYFPNVKVCNQDKPHASKRFTSRLWKCDDRVWDVYSRVIRKKGSICRLVKTRPLLGKVYAERVQQDALLQGSYITDLGLAPHRFDACCKPLIMSVLTFKPMVAMAQHIHQQKSGEESVQAGEWMDWVQNKHCVLLGFMTMAGNEALKLTRQWESEARFEVGHYRAEAENFLKTSIVLFERGKAAKVGYGKHMIDRLQEHEIVMTVNGKVKTIGGGGIHDRLIQECLEVMLQWTRLLYRTVQAEVPHFEVANSFYVMSLNGAGDELIDRHAEGIKFNAVADDVGADDVSELATCCARLAKLVDEKPEELLDQIKDVRPLAKRYFDESEALHKAWSMALTSKRVNARKNKKLPEAYRALVVALCMVLPVVSNRFRIPKRLHIIRQFYVDAFCFMLSQLVRGLSCRRASSHPLCPLQANFLLL